MKKPGQTAPDFCLEDADGLAMTLADCLAGGPLILYFYPADFTPGCTREACDIRDIHTQITTAGLQVIGISPQDGATHRRFQDKYALPFRLLCDPQKEAVRAYGVDGPLGIGTRRATFLIDSDANIVDAVLADIRIEKHRAFIEKAIALHSNARVA